MNENIDLIKILDGCPKGTEFYCSIYGVVKFMRISETNWITLSTKLGDRYISKNGRFYEEPVYDDECILFPSKDQRDWSKFERFWDKPKAERFDINTLQPFDKVLVRFSKNRVWLPDFFGYKDNIGPICAVNNCTKRQCIPYNEETKHLIGTTEDCPEYYKWWEK